MDDHAYNVLPFEFRKAFEQVNGEMPESEFIRNIWMDIAVKWYAGWTLAVEHAHSLRAPMPQLPPPERARHFRITLEPGMLPVIHETKMPGEAQTESMHVPVNTPPSMSVSGMDEVRKYPPEYVRSLQEMSRPEFQQELTTFPVPPPPPMPGTHSQAPKAPMTAAEAAAESVNDGKATKPTRREFIIINQSSDPQDKVRWLVEVTGDSLFRRAMCRDAEAAHAALEQIEGAEQMGSIYRISDERLKWWQERPHKTAIRREKL